MGLRYENFRHFDAKNLPETDRQSYYDRYTYSNKITKKGRLSGAGGNHEVLSEANLNAT
jgi:hypothetical protein